MYRQISLILAVILLTTTFNLVASKAQDSTDEAAIRRLVEQLFDAYQKKDIEGVMTCWSMSSPMFADFKQFLQTDFTLSEETHFVNVTLTRWKIEVTRASVRLRFDRRWRDARTKQPAEENNIREFQFVKEGGAWKLWLQMDASINLAERLDAAKTKAEIVTLLEDEKEIVTPDLLAMFVVTGVKYASERKFDAAFRLNDISFLIADALGGTNAKAQSHWFRGAIHYYRSEYRDALENYQRALQLFRESGDRLREAITQKDIGEIYQVTNRYTEAITQFEVSSKIMREIGEREDEAKILRSIGVTYGWTGKNAQALSVFDESLKITREIVDKKGEAETLGNFGNIYESTGRYKDALTNYEASLKLMRETGDRAGEAKILGNMGIVYGATGNYPEAMRRFEASLKIALEVDNKEAEASARNNIGTVYRSTGKYAEALVEHEASLKIERETGDRAGEVKTLNNIGIDYQSTGRYAEALSRYDESFRIALEIRDKAGEGETRGNMGVLYALMGRYTESLAQQEASLKINREVSNKAAEARSLGEIGIVYQSTGRYAEALSLLEADLKITREIGDRPGEAMALVNSGNVYQSTGKYAEALTNYEAALKIARVIGDRAGEAKTFGNIGTVYALMDKPDEALTQYEAGLKVAREIGDRAAEAGTLNNIGIIYRSKQMYPQALSQYEAALKLKLDIGDKAGEAQARNNIGNTNLMTGKYADALAQHEVSLKIFSEIGDKLGEATSLADIATVYRFQKQWQRAAETYRKALPLIETIRTQAREPSLQTGFFAQYISPYYGLVESLLELGPNRDEIFTVSERAKARTLVELMTGGKVNILKSMTDAERQREQELKAGIIGASVQLNSIYSGPALDRRRVDELTRQLNKARDDYAEFRVKLFIAHPELQFQRAGYDSLALSQLNELLFAKIPDLCLLSYLVSNDKTFLLVITAGKGTSAPVNLSVHTLKTDKDRELTAGELKKALSTFRLQYTNESAPFTQLGRDLYKILLAPAEADLKGKGHVVIVPDGMLYSLPFQALIDEQGKFFIERHTVSYAPSVTALVQMMKLADKKRKSNANTLPLFAMGRGTFPDQAQYRNLELPKAEEQVKSIARLFGVAALTGNEATKAKAIASMGAARYVHFATHGELNEVAPMESAIVLGKGTGDDGMLYARELIDMDLQAELVVLSACDTGRGQQVNGEGIVGLTWALFVAGTPTSVVTQWKVRDDSMNTLMLEFYREVRQPSTKGQPPISKAGALRRAQLNLMKDENYKHPYHWAPIALVGDWR